MAPSGQYTERQRLLKALLIVTSLQKRDDLKAYRDLKSFIGELDWADRQSLMIEERVWDYAVNVKHYGPRFVFCHPDVLQDRPSTSVQSQKYLGDMERALARGFWSRQMASGSAPRPADTHEWL